ncbi:NRDE family protein [Aquimarina brevivitae]|nr:NRDE family protein [Aquimarina brevivitae]
MCTVTLIPTNHQDFILTSNRDEAPVRQTIPPRIYDEDGVKMLYPKDALAGGTWIGISEHDSLICLLNGGFVNHRRKPGYKKSRGIVVKDLLKKPDLHLGLQSYDFTGIEPFTIIAVSWKSALSFYELVWDGSKAHFKKLDASTTHIWSSSSLYDQQMKAQRKTWFEQFLNKNQVSNTSLLQFHKTAGVGDKHIDLIMNRGFVATTSITQIKKSGEQVSMNYEDLQTNTSSTSLFTSVVS